MSKLGTRIDSLEKQLSTVQDNLNFNLGLTWAILGVIVAVLALSSFFSIKSWFNQRFEDEAKKIDVRISKFLKENPQMLWTSGKAGKIYWDSLKRENKYIINGLKDFQKENLIFLDVFYNINDAKVSIPLYNIKLNDDFIEIILDWRLYAPDLLHHGSEFANLEVEYFILWTNPIYQLIEES